MCKAGQISDTFRNNHNPSQRLPLSKQWNRRRRGIITRGRRLGMCISISALLTNSETPHQLIVYHPPSHAIQVVPHPDREGATTSGSIEPDDAEEHDEGKPRECPLCHRPWSPVITPTARPSRTLGRGDSSYFRVLERAHGFSQPGTPIDAESNGEAATPLDPISTSDADDMIDVSDLPAMGYYRRFFKEEARLGIGAEGSVYLATHVIGGNALGG